ncbi:MAG: hypothetical protein EPN94_11005 [Nitrospirae bacterium]|nr:MAG: hypothetical protein EPN94_11005 [Nitrospirota bacterium]
MANPHPKAGPGRPKGCGNKTPILLQELESVIFELSKEERIRRLRDYRDFPADKYKITGKKGKEEERVVYKNFVTMHMTVAKKQEESGQADLFDYDEEAQMCAKAEAEAHERMN